ncbi:MAG TPA: M3 family metallopeptidase, partial [Caulobacteraceae bacterium]|nr:M3 family metallopeptidase [Caulobacteraceae bacterium]
PLLAAHADAIWLDRRLFGRVKAIFDQLASLGLDAEAKQLVKVTYEAFERSGVRLEGQGHERLKALNAELSTLETGVAQKLLAGAKSSAFVVDSEAQLAGLSAQEIAAAAEDAKSRGLEGQWRLPLANFTQQPVLAKLEDRSVREALYRRSWERAEQGDENDTRATILQIAALRTCKATLLGHESFAAYALQDQMASTPATAQAFLGELAGPTRAAIEAESQALQALIADDGQNFALEPWDWEIYAERLRKQRFDLNKDELEPYLALDRVLKDGLFHVAERLYGLFLKPRTDLPVYHPDVEVYEVFDEDASAIGLIYFDFFKRDSKRGGAWMGNFVEQSKLLGTRPVVYNVCNFTKPAPSQPALLSLSDVATLFHEFGHGLHGLFADQEYPTLSGTNVARDFVELPSQFNEHWALHPDVLRRYAIHHETGEPMPDELIERIGVVARFNQAYAMGEILAAAQLDMQWHSLGGEADIGDVDAFEAEALKAAGVDFGAVPPRYRSSYFQHIWTGSYAAGYYAYLWAEMLDVDAYHWFLEHGGLTRENGQRFRDLILSRGHSGDYGEMFRAFYGRDPDIGPMLEHRGLQPSAN